jgi:hypothetical protein
MNARSLFHFILLIALKLNNSGNTIAFYHVLEVGELLPQKLSESQGLYNGRSHAVDEENV